jgi:hypothetical protein
MMCQARSRATAALLAIAAASITVGCSSDPDPPPPPPDLSPALASMLINQKWTQDGWPHYTVTFHSDTLIACGEQNNLWKRVETPRDGVTLVAYNLTDAGRKAMFSADLKESGKFHEVILQGPYLNEINNIAPLSPDMRQVAFHWEIDWNKAPAEMKACLPRFELSGSQAALFKLDGQLWTLASFLKPGEVPAAPTTDGGGKVFP